APSWSAPSPPGRRQPLRRAPPRRGWGAGRDACRLTDGTPEPAAGMSGAQDLRTPDPGDDQREALAYRRVRANGGPMTDAIEALLQCDPESQPPPRVQSCSP